MDNYLFRISTKKTDAWSRKEPKPVYFVAESEEKAKAWADVYLTDGLSVSKISKLAVQLSPSIFSGSINKA